MCGSLLVINAIVLADNKQVRDIYFGKRPPTKRLRYPKRNVYFIFHEAKMLAEK
jgi:hypothetical protein